MEQSSGHGNDTAAEQSNNVGESQSLDGKKPDAEEHTPDGQRPVDEDVADAVEGGGVGEDLDARGLQAPLAGALLEVHGDPVQFRNWLQVDQISGKEFPVLGSLLKA